MWMFRCHEVVSLLSLYDFHFSIEKDYLFTISNFLSVVWGEWRVCKDVVVVMQNCLFGIIVFDALAVVVIAG